MQIAYEDCKDSPCGKTVEALRIKTFLARFRVVNPDELIAARFSERLQKYAYLSTHLQDALIAATARRRNLPLLTANVRHFAPIEEITVVRFSPTPKE